MRKRLTALLGEFNYFDCELFQNIYNKRKLLYLLESDSVFLT